MGKDQRIYTAVPKDACSGCGACCASCPTGAIQMEPDGEGFAYPTMADKSRCVDCGKCAQVCPVLQAKEKTADADREPACYAVVNLDESVRAESSSGGAFSLFAQQILSAGGAVFGAALSEDCRRVEHICVEDEAGLERLRMSKYVQSSIGSCYAQAGEMLKAGRQVLFSGTACQIEGLRSYLGRDYLNLLCIDLICHGVPSPKVWEQYVQFREQKAGAAVRRVTFRDKMSGWKRYTLTMHFDGGGAYHGRFMEDPYIRVFLRDVALRPSCYHCSFKTLHRTADITLADLWGLEDILPDWNDNKGVSLLMIHGDKGQTMFDGVKDRCRWQAIDREAALRRNPSAIRSCARPHQRDKLFQKLEQLPFDQLAERYGKSRGRLKIFVWRFMKKLGIVH